MMSEMKKIMIEDTEYSYDPEREYIKDGHAYCKNCHERKDLRDLRSCWSQINILKNLTELYLKV